MKKRCVSAFLALAMALSLAVPALAAQAQYADVSPDSWYYPAVNYVTQHGLMVGVGDNRFDPDGNTQRGALMTMLARFDGADLPATTPWYQAGMDWAMEEGISDGSDPEGNITRVQTVTMMWRLLGEPVVSADYSDVTYNSGRIDQYINRAESFNRAAYQRFHVRCIAHICRLGHNILTGYLSAGFHQFVLLYIRHHYITAIPTENFYCSKAHSLGGTCNYLGAIALGESLGLVNEIGIEHGDMRIAVQGLFHDERKSVIGTFLNRNGN